MEKCRPCQGTGTVTRILQIFPGMVQQTQSICHDCRGEGEKIRGGFNSVIYYNPQVGLLSSGSSAQKFSTHEKFLRTENFPKISLLKVELQNFFRRKICVGQSHFTNFSFCREFS